MLHYFGDGERCACAHCGRELTRETLEADRIQPGGSYARRNIQPACRTCNVMRSDNPDWQPVGVGEAR